MKIQYSGPAEHTYSREKETQIKFLPFVFGYCSMAPPTGTNVFHIYFRLSFRTKTQFFNLVWRIYFISSLENVNDDNLPLIILCCSYYP